jgi:hypothetical protein
MVQRASENVLRKIRKQETEALCIRGMEERMEHGRFLQSRPKSGCSFIVTLPLISQVHSLACEVRTIVNSRFFLKMSRGSWLAVSKHLSIRLDRLKNIWSCFENEAMDLRNMKQKHLGYRGTRETVPCVTLKYVACCGTREQHTRT